MNILFLNAWDHEGGAARAAFRLLKGVQQFGFDARMLVKKKTLTDPSIIGPRTRVDRMMAYIRPILENYYIKRYPGWNGLTYSPALFFDRLQHQASAVNPDIIHLHWVGDGFLKIETLPGFKRPLVWTIHDSWPFTGGCHIPFKCTRYRQSCGACPTLGSSEENDLSSRVWRRKRDSWRDLHLTVVSPSRWLADCARSSSLLQEASIRVIPNGLDLHVYRPVAKDVAREALSLPKDKKLILFGGIQGISDRNKGFHLLEAALHKVAGARLYSDVELLVFGSLEPESPPELRLKANYLGWLHDDMSIALLYAAADVFVVPSIQENLPNTIMEALACGTPCVAFNQGGVPDLIEHERNGYLAEPYDAADLAHGIIWVLQDDMRWQTLSHRSRQNAEKKFSLDDIVKRYVALYEEMLRKTY